jgi:hypothetical protein
MYCSPDPFSPNGDGVKDNTTFYYVPEGIDEPDTWLFTIEGVEGENIYFTVSGTGTPYNIIWNGFYQGEVLPDNDYLYKMKSMGLNSEICDTGTAWISWNTGYIRLDATPPTCQVTVNPAVFSPDGD